ncbi:MAG: hypothetical protein HC828_05110 [Blastochloris sp.]|nr:hypothetical protein [Blastochloris sp.]
MNSIPPFMLIIVGPLLLWAPLFWLLAYVSGWRRLAQYYAAHTPRSSRTYRFCNGTVGYGLSYRGSLEVTINDEGLWLRPFTLFRPGHAPLAIPWSSVIRVWEAPQWGYRAIGMQLQACPDLPILLPAEVFATVREILPPMESPPAFPFRRLRIFRTWVMLMLPGLVWLWLMQICLNQAW